MKLKDIMAGNRAIHRVRLPLVNVPTGDAAPPELAAQRECDQAAAPNGQAAFSLTHVDVGVRVLLGREIETVLDCADKYASGKGAEATPGNPIYDYGYRLYTVAIACVDPDTDPKDPDPAFGDRGNVQSAVDYILNSPHIGRDGILYLSERQQYWQDLLNPQRRTLTPEQLYIKIGEVAVSKDARPFWELSPGMQWTFARFMANLLLTSPDHKYFFGADSSEKSSSSEPSATASS